jgi:predicted lipid-binding transport protein (Tim44 family)
MTRWAIAIFVGCSAAACTPTASLPEATRGYAKAVAEVAAATKEDVNRCQNAATEEERTAFCERAKKHCDMIQSTADDLAKSAK